MIVERHHQWKDPKFDNFLKQWYNSKVKVDPAMLAIGLRNLGFRCGREITKAIINRLYELGLRKTRKYEQSNRN